MGQPRRTQAERTATTRAALLAATVDTLVERGYRRTTTTDVARRAGVSPGALLHHFPTKADLLSAAVEHVMQGRMADFRKAMADLPSDALRGPAAVDLLWEMFAGPTFLAWLELWVAARTDPEISAAVVRVDRDFVAASEDVFREVFADESAANPALPHLAVNLVFTFLTGLATGQLAQNYSPADPDELLAVFKLLTSTAMPAEPERTAP